MNPIKVYILLPVHNGYDKTKIFIRCLLKQTHENYQLIVIDDGSVDGTDRLIAQAVPDAIVLKGNGNLWWTGAIQKGVDYLNTDFAPSASDILLLMNNDTEFGPEFLYNSVNIMKSNPNTILMARNLEKGSNLVLDSGITVDWSKYLFSLANDNDPIHMLSGRGLFIKYFDVKNIGRFRSFILPHYGSDNEYTYRAKKLGYNLITNQTVYLWGDRNTSGVSLIQNLDKFSLSSLYSLKRKDNPIILIKFILLTCPKKYVLQNILRVIAGEIKVILKYILLILRKH